jgi:hypothetical protein
VDHRMGHVLCAGTELKHRQNLGEGIDSYPQPQDLCGTAQSGSQQWSTCRCGSWRVQKECVCNVCACSRARVSRVVMVACR